ncbi:unnamed protein product [Timema podura]|uniref:Uncharacterized protein n=1 Tax=Timema podura TaxID=61482 RepID=A0ABN7PFV5_TIMPD|nr:unnamed protein product [Timema podura]
MALTYELRHSRTKQGNSLTLTDYTMALSYKLRHSGNVQGLIQDNKINLHRIKDSQSKQPFHEVTYGRWVTHSLPAKPPHPATNTRAH